MTALVRKPMMYPTPRSSVAISLAKTAALLMKVKGIFAETASRLMPSVTNL